MAGACGSKFTSCEEQETCEGPQLPTNPKGNGGEGGAEGGATCSENPSICGEHATCKTTDGVASCVCDEGYEGDGETCEDIDKCAEGDGPCDENATCTNTAGSFECTCDDGFFGSGITCSPLTDLVSVGEDGMELDGDALSRPALSADGRVIAYTMRTYNDYDPVDRVFVHDYEMRANTLLTVTPDGSPGTGYFPTISADGTRVLFNSNEGDLAGDEGQIPAIYVRDLTHAVTQYLATGTPWGAVSYPSSLSADGQYAVFSDGGIRVKSLVSGAVTRVDVNSDGQPADIEASVAPHISADGRYVTFESSSPNLGVSNGKTHIHVRDLMLKRTTMASVSSSSELADEYCSRPVLSGNGRFVAFNSPATNLTPYSANDHNQVFVRDLVAGTTTLVSLNSLGMPGNGNSFSPSLSHDGRFITFASQASDLVAGDTNGISDIFVRDLVEGITTRVSVSSLGEQADDNSYDPVISADGRVVAFVSRASNLAPGASGEHSQVFRRVFRPE